ncbi:MAG: helix-turn-helix transcriptional regulator [Treponema sp.]|jgi:DNA-binding HxlR family transcriptional regulator|nr:helix-turn-helix transcriptional regulator [Treponema sp.]
MLTKEELPACPVATTVNLIGNKWKLLILRDLLMGTKRFGELRKGVTGISQKVLTDNLRALEEDGIVLRAIFAEVPPRVEYSLSELGETLRPIIDVMGEWGTAYKARFAKPKTKKG